MNKYFTTLQNERGDVLPNYRAQVVDNTGAIVTIYEDKSGTRFTDSSGNIINYATASANGRVSFYFTAEEGQVLQTLDAAGDLVDSEPDFADNLILENLPGSIAQSVVTDLPTDLAAKAATADLASTDAAKGAALVGFKQSGTGAVARTVEAKAQETVSVKDFGAVGDGATDDTAEINAAFASGAEEVVFPRGTYITTGVVIASGSSVKKVKGYGRPVLQLTAAANRIALDIQKAQYVTIDGLDVRSGPEANIGTAMSDGSATVGVRTTIGGSYLYLRNIRTAGFSQAGIQARQVVNMQLENVDGHNCYRAREWQPDTGNPCSAVRIYNGYVTGCTSGDYAENGLTDFVIDGVIYEYCGTAGEEAGVRIRGGGGRISSLYFELNERNLWLTDCQLVQPAKGNEFAATNADVKTYVGTASADRGYSRLTNRKLTVTEIEGDISTGGTVNLVSDIGIGGAGTTGLSMHVQRSEVRARLEATSTNGKYFELVSGGGNTLAEGFFGLVAEAGGQRILISDDPGEGVRITGSGAGAEFWVGGSKVLGQRQAAVADATGGATVDAEARAAINTLLARLRSHGLIAT